MHRLETIVARNDAAVAKHKAQSRPLDQVSQIIAYEQGDLSEEEAIELFQALIDNGMAWQLQGSYGRTAVALIEAGHCHR